MNFSRPLKRLIASTILVSFCFQNSIAVSGVPATPSPTQSQNISQTKTPAAFNTYSRSELRNLLMPDAPKNSFESQVSGFKLNERQSEQQLRTSNFKLETQNRAELRTDLETSLHKANGFDSNAAIQFAQNFDDHPLLIKRSENLTVQTVPYRLKQLQNGELNQLMQDEGLQFLLARGALYQDNRALIEEIGKIVQTVAQSERSDRPFEIQKLEFPSAFFHLPHEATRNVYAYYYLPKHEDPAKQFPAVIFPSYIFKDGLARPLSIYLASHGIAVLEVNLPFYGEREPAELKNLSSTERYIKLDFDSEKFVGFFLQSISDLLLAVRWLGSRPEIDSARIGISGQSISASMATLAYSIDPHIQFLDVMVPISNYANLIWGPKRYQDVSRFFEGKGISKDAFERATEIINLHHVAAAHPRDSSTIILGTVPRDELASTQDSDRLFELLGKPRRIVGSSEDKFGSPHLSGLVSMGHVIFPSMVEMMHSSRAELRLDAQEKNAPYSKGFFLKLAALTFAAGFLSSGFGVGGGVLVVPALVTLFRMDIKKAVVISAAAVLPISTVGFIVHLVSGMELAKLWISIGTGAPVLAGSLAAVRIGVGIVQKMKSETLKKLFTAFLMLVGLKYIFLPGGHSIGHLFSSGELPSYLFYSSLFVLGLFGGVSFVMFGIGGGLIYVPVFHLVYGLPFFDAVTTSFAIIIPTSIYGFLKYRISSLWDPKISPKVLMPPAAFGALIGAWLIHSVPKSIVEPAFGVFLVGVSSWMLYQSKSKSKPQSRPELRESLTAKQEEMIKQLGFRVDPAIGKLYYTESFQPMQLNLDLWAVRHGTTHNIELIQKDGKPRFQGQADDPKMNYLTDFGKKEARETAGKLYDLFEATLKERMEDVIVVKNPLGRVLSTAEPFEQLVEEKLGKKPNVVIMPSSQEIGFGEWENLTVDQIRELFGDEEAEKAVQYSNRNVIAHSASGESFIDLLGRAHEF
ncbi:MAG: TSUP family transporter, partial [Candidatus Omnitrophica bacterium]|nr:TSUP family transporter [Candidatus Omnitrophota bacterium]